MQPNFVSVYASKHSLADVVAGHQLGPDNCFVCGILLDASNRTVEHVIPLWVQRHFNLLTRKLRLLNHTFIQYKQLVVPCCHSCNNKLSRIECDIERALAGGKSELDKLPPMDLFIWLAKIFFGLLYKELFLLLDRRDRDKGSIVTEELIREFEMLHYFLQSINVPMEFVGFSPYSIFTFSLQAPANPRDWFDLTDFLAMGCIAIRLKDVGIIAVLNDGGCQQNAGREYMAKFQSFDLHPLQFYELTAFVAAIAQRFACTLSYTSVGGKDATTPVIVLQHGLAGPVYRPHDPNIYAQLLAHTTGYPLEAIFQPPDRTMSWLRRLPDVEKPVFLDIKEVPWPPMATPKFLLNKVPERTMGKSQQYVYHGTAHWNATRIFIQTISAS